MGKIGVIATDTSRARFITAELLDDPALEGSPRLMEYPATVNPAGSLQDHESFSNRLGQKPAGGGIGGSTTDDHRDRNRIENERRFARDVIGAAERFISDQHPSELVLAATPHFLGILRPEVESKHWNGVRVAELAEDLSNQSLPQIQQVLTRRGYLPEPQLPRGGVYRPKGQEPASR